MISPRRLLLAVLAALAAIVVVAQSASAADLVTFGGASTVSADTSGSVTVSTPAGASTDNGGSLLLAQVSVSASTISAPGGWTEVASTTKGDVTQKVYSRRYTSVTASYTFAATANRPLVVTLAVYNGIDGSDPLQVATGASGDSGTGTTATSNVDGGTGGPGNAAAGSRAVGFATIDGSPSLPTLSLTGPSGAASRGSGSAQGNAAKKVITGLADFGATIPNTSAFTWSVSASRDWIAYEAMVRAGASGAIASAPGAPQSVSGTAGDGKVTVSWSAPSSDGGAAITGYTVTSSPDGKTCTTTGALTCDVTGLTNGTAYTFTVTATNDVGTGSASAASASVTPVAAPSPSPSPSLPGAPRNVKGQAGDASAVISWQKPSGSGGSGITRYTATASPGGASCTATTGFQCTITGLTNGTAYTATVVARNSDGDGPASAASAAFTPTAAASVNGGRKNSTDNRPRPKVTLCHATKSETNPYVVITVDPNSVITKGHDQHQDGRDIIPAFEYEENGATISYPGKNLTTEGLALLATGCKQTASTSVAAALINAAKPPPKKTRVTLCHATSSATNPYVRITVAPEAVYKEGHDQHQDGRDIIPPFSYDADGATQEYPGKNWDSESQAIFNNGCKPLGPETGPASLSADVTFCAAIAGGQYVLTTQSVSDVLARDPNNGDIIPAFTYSDGGTKSFPGRNWSAANQAILGKGCVAPIPTTPADPVVPSVTCVTVADDGSFSAVFGYANPNAVAVSAPVGAANSVTLDAGAAGATIGAQPTTFLPGSLDVALTVTGIGSEGSVTWTIAAPGEARSATATSASPRCPAPAATPELSVRAECVVDPGNGTYSVLFGYQSDETSTLTVPVGDLNALVQSAGGPIDQVQTSAFTPGLHAGAFTVTGIKSTRSVTWRVVTGSTARTATANVDSLPSCYPPEQPPTGCVLSGPSSDGSTTPCVLPNPGPGGNVTCEQLGYSNSSGRINYSDAGFAQAFARQGITVSVTGGTYVTWSAGFPVGAVIVKGGPRANIYEYSPGRYGDQGLASPVNASGNPAGLSNLTICWNPGAPGPNPTDPPAPPAPTATPQPIGVSVACVKKNTDGTYDAVFGYTNPNALSVSIDGGDANYVAESPGEPEDQLRGQPTSFMPGTTTSGFTVYGVPGAKSVTWTVSYYGTRQATADLNFPTACSSSRSGDPLVGPPDPPATPTPRTDPTDPSSPIPTPPPSAPPTPATAQLGVFVTCASVGRTTYSATFGYTNPSGATLTIPAGPGNRLVGARSYDRGQPAVFAAGTNANAFTVTRIPRSGTPQWEVTLPSGQVVSVTATRAAPRCAATSRPAGPGVTTTITTPRRVETRSRVRTNVTVRNPGTAPLYRVRVTIPTPRNTSRFTRVTRPAGSTCVLTASRAVCTFSSLMPGVTRSIGLRSIASTPSTRYPLSRAGGVSSSGSVLTAVDTTPLTVYALGGLPVTG